MDKVNKKYKVTKINLNTNKFNSNKAKNKTQCITDFDYNKVKYNSTVHKLFKRHKPHLKPI